MDKEENQAPIAQTQEHVSEIRYFTERPELNQESGVQETTKQNKYSSPE
jgi:hypothetical protein